VREQPLVWREEVSPGDRESVRRICEISGFFSAEEVDMAVELVEEHLAKGVASGYHFLFAQHGDTVLGFACYGPIPGSLSRSVISAGDVRRKRSSRLHRPLLAISRILPARPVLVAARSCGMSDAVNR
jgi:hypothetical protein